MKRKFLKICNQGLWLLLMAGSLYSCKDALTVDPKDVVTSANMYQTKFDANAAVLGVYTKLNDLADKYVILNELRGDLIDVTRNADSYLQQINNHEATTDNPYINPAPFYAVIQNCNDVLYNLDIMYKTNKLKDFEYAERYSDIGAIRCWLYLQLATHFGNVPYVTQPLVKVEDIQDAQKYPFVPFDAMLDSLIHFMETKVTFKGRYSEWFVDYFNYATYTGGGVYISSTFIPKYFILGDLYLWKGNYTQAAINYRALADIDMGNATLEMQLEAHKVAYTFFNIVQNDNYASIANDWYTMFYLPLAIGKYNAHYPMPCEFEWLMVFNKNYDNNPLIDLLAWNKKYMLMPSKAIIDSWDEQVMYNGTPKDKRGLNSSYLWSGMNSDPIVMKYLWDYMQYGSNYKGGKWFIYRAGLLNLRLAEAANRANRSRIALALLNNGITASYPTATGDVAPWDFSGINDSPRTWYRNAGIRGRVDVSNVTVPNGNDSITYVEGKIIDEAALELAFEGNRWGDLLRIAMRTDNPAFLADRVYAKLEKAGNPNAGIVRSKLMNKDWFLPFKLK